MGKPYTEFVKMYHIIQHDIVELQKKKKKKEKERKKDIDVSERVLSLQNSRLSELAFREKEKN